MLKHEALARLGYEEKDLMLADTRSVSSKSSQSLVPYQDPNRPKAIDYLSKGREQKESVRDFITNARNILMSQIAINDKTEETERLKEYIIMEKEKLEEAKKTFEEDKDKFTKYMDDLTKKAGETAEEVKRLTAVKNEKIQNITRLAQEIQKKKSKIKKIDEELAVYKQHKQFLDTLAISAGKKQVREKQTPS